MNMNMLLTRIHRALGSSIRVLVVLSVLMVSLFGSAVDAATATPTPSQQRIPVPPFQQITKESDKAPAIVQAAADATDYGSKVLEDNFGGAWVDQKANVAHVLVKDTPTNAVANASLAIGKNIRHPETVVYDRAQFSRKELRAIQDKIIADRAMIASKGTNVVAVGEKTDANKLLVQVVSSSVTTTSAATTTLGQLYGSNALVVQAVASAPELADRNAGYPYRGGYSLNGTNGENCTLGFVGYTATQWEIITAGHCYDVGITVGHPGIGVIGNVAINDYRTNSRVDIAAIPITGYGYEISKTLIRNDPSLANVDSVEYQQLYGKFVCKSGVVTNQTCLSVTTVHTTVVAGGVTLTDQIIASGSAGAVMGGDSGGPVYMPYGQASVSAEGIVSAKNADGGLLYYSFIYNAIPDDGLNVNYTLNPCSC